MRTRFVAHLSPCLLLLSACDSEVAPTTPTVATPAAAPTDAPSFHALLDGQPYAANVRDVCMLNRFNSSEQPQFLFSFTHVERDDTLQLGLARGDDQAGARDVLYVLVNHGDASFSGIRRASADITALTRVADGFLVSGRFALALEGSSMSAGRPEVRQLEVSEGRFERIHCLDLDAVAPADETDGT
jgi:hypothetical protein